ncbi:MAG TPA: helix-turn-helix domain-containing protein [Steroidobacteraceae bacterium]|nr:helix-turn-helix domain-containing protein [Steroidobacteraceae bacterium]
MDYPLLTPAQLAAYLRSLRRSKRLTQSALGSKLGLSQRRIATIEHDPDAVSLGQLMRILALLDARLILRVPGKKDDTTPAPRSDEGAW